MEHSSLQLPLDFQTTLLKISNKKKIQILNAGGEFERGVNERFWEIVPSSQKVRFNVRMILQNAILEY